jgi:hypothetical protein
MDQRTITSMTALRANHFSAAGAAYPRLEHELFRSGRR